MHSRAQAWYGRRTWHWRDWPTEVLLEGKRRADARILMAAELLIVAERRRPVKEAGEVGGGAVPASPLLQQFVREGAQVRPVARPIPVQERPPVTSQFSGTPAGRDGSRR